MEALVQQTKESLLKKSELELRTILRKEFGVTNGITAMNLDTLSNEILKHVQFKKDNIKQNHNIDIDKTYIDSNKVQYQVIKVNVAGVNVLDEDGGSSIITVDDFHKTMTVTRYKGFQSKSVIVNDEEPVVQKTKVRTNPNKSKSDLVRDILTKLHEQGQTITSGVVRKKLKDDHKMDIHPSFAHTLITKFNKALNESGGDS